MIGQMLATESRTALERYCDARARAVPHGQTTLCRVLGEFPCVVDTRTSVGARLALEGYWQMWICQFLARTVKPGWRVIDAGAGTTSGYFALLLRELVGQQGYVEAWENIEIKSLRFTTALCTGKGFRVRSVSSWEKLAIVKRGFEHVPHFVMVEGDAAEMWAWAPVLHVAAVLLELQPMRMHTGVTLAKARELGYRISRVNFNAGLEAVPPEADAELARADDTVHIYLESDGS